MISEFIHRANSFKAIIAELKKESSYYPSVLIKYYDSGIGMDFRDSVEESKACYVSTLLRIEREGVWYVVHCVESIISNEMVDEMNLLKRFMASVYQIQFLYQIPNFTDPDGIPLQDVDRIQQSEVDRLTFLYMGEGGERSNPNREL